MYSHLVIPTRITIVILIPFTKVILRKLNVHLLLNTAENAAWVQQIPDLQYLLAEQKELTFLLLI